MRKLMVLTLMAGFLGGCAHPMGQFTVMSNRNVNGLESISSSAGTTRVSGESCRDFVLFIPVSSARDLTDAFAQALKQAPGANALKDVTVKRDGLFTLFYNKQCYSVEGTPIVLGK